MAYNEVRIIPKANKDGYIIIKGDDIRFAMTLLKAKHIKSIMEKDHGTQTTLKTRD